MVFSASKRECYSTSSLNLAGGYLLTGNDLPLPKSWPRHVRHAVLRVFSLAFTTLTHTRSWAVNSPIERVRMKAHLVQAVNEIALLSEEIRIKDARMERIPPHHRPHYSPTERMAILELRATRGWSAAQTARTFLLEPDTIASWTRRIDEEGMHPLVLLPTPVNKFPDFVAYLVHRLKTLCPTMGKKRIAQVLARAGLTLGATTIGRMLKAPRPSPPEGNGGSQEQAELPGESSATRTVTAKHPAMSGTWI
jgi:hypothetical protein